MNELKTEETIEKLKDMIIDFGDGLLEFETKDVNILLNQLILQENYNDMLVTECENLKSEILVLEQTVKFNADVNIGLMKTNFELKQQIEKMHHVLHGVYNLCHEDTIQHKYIFELVNEFLH